MQPRTDERFFFYEATGEVMWEWRIGAPKQDLLRIFHNGRAIFENGSPGGAILHADHLGSPRVKADVFTPTVRCRDLYSPFGQKHTAPCDAHRVGFTGKERDGETGFDYFGARYYAPVPGRFLSPDPLFDSADPADPQSWNRYSYTRNNPIRFVDPDGAQSEDFMAAALEVGEAALKVAGNTVAAANNLVTETFNFFFFRPFSVMATAVAGEPVDLTISPAAFFEPNSLDQEAAMLTFEAGAFLRAPSALSGVTGRIRDTSKMGLLRVSD